jgi:hypothetical protein
MYLYNYFFLLFLLNAVDKTDYNNNYLHNNILMNKTKLYYYIVTKYLVIYNTYAILYCWFNVMTEEISNKILKYASEWF